MRRERRGLRLEGGVRREEATGELLPLSATAQCRSLPCLHLLPTVAALASASRRHCSTTFSAIIGIFSSNTAPQAAHYF